MTGLIFFLFYFDFDSYFVFLFCLFLVFQFIPSSLAFHSIGNQLRRVPWIGLAKASSEVYLVFFFTEFSMVGTSWIESGGVLWTECVVFKCDESFLIGFNDSLQL